MGSKPEKKQTLGIVCLPYHNESDDLVLDVTVRELAKLMQENVCVVKANYSSTTPAICEIINSLRYEEGAFYVFGSNLSFSAASLDDYPVSGLI